MYLQKLGKPENLMKIQRLAKCVLHVTSSEMNGSHWYLWSGWNMVLVTLFSIHLRPVLTKSVHGKLPATKGIMVH